MKWKITPSVAWQMVGDEAVLVDVRTGSTLGLNETGSFIWRRLESCDEQAIVDEMVATYGIPKEQALEDMKEFLGILAARGFAQRSE